MSTRCAPLILFAFPHVLIKDWLGSLASEFTVEKVHRPGVPQSDWLRYQYRIWSRDAWLGPRTVTIQCFVVACLLRGGFLGAHSYGVIITDIQFVCIWGWVAEAKAEAGDDDYHVACKLGVSQPATPRHLGGSITWESGVGSCKTHKPSTTINWCSRVTWLIISSFRHICLQILHLLQFVCFAPVGRGGGLFNSIDRHDRHVTERQGVMIISYRGIMILKMCNDFPWQEFLISPLWCRHWNKFDTLVHAPVYEPKTWYRIWVVFSSEVGLGVLSWLSPDTVQPCWRWCWQRHPIYHSIWGMPPAEVISGGGA